MKKMYLELQKMLANGILNIEDYFTIDIGILELRPHGHFTMSKHVDLISKGFKPEWQSKGWMYYTKPGITIVLSD